MQTEALGTVQYLQALANEAHSGELLIQHADESGKVYLSRGRIVWAFATGQDESFQSILIREHGIPKEKLLDGIKAARAQGKRSLDEILVALGIENFQTRRMLIERHSSSAFRTFLRWPAPKLQFSPQAPHASDTGTNPPVGLSLEEVMKSAAQPGGRQIAPSPAAHTIPPGSAPHGAAQPAAIPVARPTSKPGALAARPTYKNRDAAVEVSTLDEALEGLREEIPHFLAAILIESSTGMPVSVVSDAPELDSEAVSAFYRDLGSKAVEALKVMGKSEGDDGFFEEILITTPEEFVVLRQLKKSSYYLFLLLEKQANPGLAKVTVRKYLGALNSFLD